MGDAYNLDLSGCCSFRFRLPYTKSASSIPALQDYSLLAFQPPAVNGYNPLTTGGAGR